MNIEQERELFEEWYGSQMWAIDDDYGKEDMWQAWQARAKVNSWISVDTPPEDSTWVMIKTTSPLTNDRIVTMAFYEFNEEANEAYWLSHHNESGTADDWEDVTHWQPLPQMNGE